MAKTEKVPNFIGLMTFLVLKKCGPYMKIIKYMAFSCREKNFLGPNFLGLKFLWDKKVWDPNEIEDHFSYSQIYLFYKNRNRYVKSVLSETVQRQFLEISQPQII